MESSMPVVGYSKLLSSMPDRTIRQGLWSIAVAAAILTTLGTTDHVIPTIIKHLGMRSLKSSGFPRLPPSTGFL
jgi:hypothetical protein